MRFACSLTLGFLLVACNGNGEDGGGGIDADVTALCHSFDRYSDPDGSHCRATAGCHYATWSYHQCAEGAFSAACGATAIPSLGSGPSCFSLSPAECGHRDDCTGHYEITCAGSNSTSTYACQTD